MAITPPDALEALTGQRTDRTEARNALRHMISLSLTKVADGLIDPKLVLSWLLNALGAPAAFVGALVPIREAGALLPQILLGRQVEQMRRRKWAWVMASLGQGVAAGLIAISAVTLTGWAAGLAICGALGVLALSRAGASVSYKDILGKTVGKTRRGTVTGVAGSVSSVAVLAFALLLISGWLQSASAVAVAIGLASCLWIAAALLFSTISEEPSKPQQGRFLDFSPLKNDAQFRRFLWVRGALSATALAPPYLVLLGGSDSALGQLGALVLASSAASFLSSLVWGRMADRSSRRVLMMAALGGAAAMALALVLAGLGLNTAYWAMPLALFVLMIAYHGVRQGRSTYLVDMSPEDQRPAYAALANTIIGALLLLVGLGGGLLSLAGPVFALMGLGALCLAGAWMARGLDEVEEG